MGDAIEGMKAFQAANQLMKNTRTEQAARDYHEAARVARSNEMELRKLGSGHYQLIGPEGAGWLINLYPGNQRIYHDKNRPQAPFLNLPLDREWTLEDVVLAAGGKCPEHQIPEELRTGTMYDAINPMRYLHTAVKIVGQLNEIGMERMGCGGAHVSATDTYLAILWGEVVLWDSEGVYREDREFDDEEDWEPTLELCQRILAEEGRKLVETFRDHQQVTDAGAWNVEVGVDDVSRLVKVTRLQRTADGRVIKECLSRTGQWVTVMEFEEIPEECLTLPLARYALRLPQG